MSLNLTPEEKHYIQRHASYLDRRSYKVSFRLWILGGLSVFFFALSFLMKFFILPTEKSGISDTYFTAYFAEYFGIFLLVFSILLGRDIFIRQRIITKILREKLKEEERLEAAKSPAEKT
jgi:hypothetical protein